MAHGEVVMRGLAGVREAAHVLVAHGVEERVGTAGEHLVRVALVRDVEDDLVRRGVEDTVQRDGELDDGQVGGHVPADDGRRVDDGAANLLAEGGKLSLGQRLHVGRPCDALQVHLPVPPSP